MNSTLEELLRGFALAKPLAKPNGWLDRECADAKAPTTKVQAPENLQIRSSNAAAMAACPLALAQPDTARLSGSEFWRLLPLWILELWDLELPRPGHAHRGQLLGPCAGLPLSRTQRLEALNRR
jgi:hypothetical protein